MSIKAPVLQPSVTTMTPRQQRRAMRANPIDFLSRCADEQGPVVRLQLDRESFLLSGPEDIRHVLVTDPLNYPKEHHSPGWFRSIFGRSLPFLEGTEHRRTRKSIQSQFKPSSLDAVPGSVHAHVERVVATWPKDGPLDVAGGMRRITFGVAGELILGTKSTSWAEQLFGAINLVHRYIVAQMPGPVAWPRLRRPLTSAWRRHRRARRQLDAMLLDWIARRRAEGPTGDDVLATVLRLQKAETLDISDREVRDHCVNLFLAATDPVAYASSWALYFLSEAPESEARLVEQANAVLGETDAPTREQLQALTHAQRALSEALRLRPSTWMMEREPHAEATLPSGTVLPAGSRVMISPYVVHHRPELYAEPCVFDPDRFSPARLQKRSPYTYLPFGAGPRVCLGQHMAMFTGTLMIALLLRKFQFHRIDGQSTPFNTFNGFTIQPPEGRLVMRCCKRLALPVAARDGHRQ